MQLRLETALVKMKLKLKLKQEAVPAPRAKVHKKLMSYSRVPVTAPIVNYLALQYVASEELPYTKFEGLIQLQKINGVKILDGKATTHACKAFISYLAEIVRTDVKDLLKSANFISGMCDGSEARKTKEEKELIYVKVIVDGKPMCLFLRCQSMKTFGGTDASSVKKAFLDAFAEYGIDVIGTDKTKIISVCADGASVNMGCLNGAMSSLKPDINWLLIVHCSLHKLELSIKDSFKKSSAFEQINDLMMNLYYLFRNSSKNWRLMLLLAEKINVSVRRYPKVHGTRFVSHKERGLQVLLYNFCVFLLFAENAMETRGLLTQGMSHKVAGFHRKLLDYGFVACASLYLEVLKVTAHVTYTLEAVGSVISDVFDALDDCQEKLDDMAKEEEIPLPSVPGCFLAKKHKITWLS